MIWMKRSIVFLLCVLEEASATVQLPKTSSLSTDTLIRKGVISNSNVTKKRRRKLSETQSSALDSALISSESNSTEIPITALSSHPSIRFSNFPTGSPTKATTLRPSNFQTGSPTKRTTLKPSNFPSELPTKTITSKPSVSPTEPATQATALKPSDVPTGSPTERETLAPSEMVSDFPSTIVSLHPTVSHSILPTKFISTVPSMQPSLSPTPECYDLPSYQSPLNKFLTCQSHQNTDCRKWKLVGLNDEEVKDLIESCPISCDVSCQSNSPTAFPSAIPSIFWEVLVSEFTFYIYNLPGIVSDTEKFESFSLKYLSTVVRSKGTNLTSFIVKSQQIVNSDQRALRGENYRKDDRRDRRNTRHLGEISALKLTVSVSAQTSGKDAISLSDLTELTVMGIESSGYREYMTGYLNLGTSLVTSMEEIPSKGKGEQVNGSSKEDNLGDDLKGSKERRGKSGSIAAIMSSIIVVSVAAVGIGFLYKRRDEIKLFRNSGPANRQQEVMSTSSNGQESYDGRISYDDGDHTVDHSFLSRVLSASSSPLGLSPSNSNVDDSEAILKNERDGVTGSQYYPAFPAQIHQKTSPVDVLKKKLFSHPAHTDELQISHIPPMIVIDNIDDDDLTPQRSGKSSDNRQDSADESCQDDYEEEDLETGMVVRRVEATSDLVAAFSAKKPVNPMQAYNLWHPIKGDDGSEARTEGTPHTNLSSRLSLGEASTMSTPNTGKVTGESIKKKSIFTFDPKNEMDQEDDFATLFEKKMKEGDRSANKRLRLGSLFKRKKNQSDYPEEISPHDASHYESDAESSEGSSVMREKDRLDEANQILSPNEVSKNDLDHSPQRQGCPGSELDPAVNSSELMKADLIQDMKYCDNRHHKRMSSGGSIFTHSHKRSVSETSFTSGFIYSFLAPCSGKLGIIIQSRPSTAPTIYQVKDYSPLFGQVEPGDKIIAVDGNSTTNMSTAEVTSLLAMQRSNKNDNTQRIKVTIMSRRRKDGIQPEREGSIAEHFTYDMRDDENDAPVNEIEVGHDFNDDDSDVDEAEDQDFHMIGTVNTEDDEDASDEDNDHLMCGTGDFL
mmetsp:Transcript_11825/g.17929  ORF Transcript_11825/g.17929 Transcript_11825/m.17929 type:complete len:1069 (-) Transcript_11825:4-3210(-)